MIRKTAINDLKRVQEIYSFARGFMIMNNNPHQWQDKYPETNAIIEDIKLGNSYVLEENGCIFGVFSMFFGKDPTYEHIDGNWLNDYPYITIHKVASDGTHKGVLKSAIEYAFKFISDVRIDTHEDNNIMHHLLEKYGFTRCGVIYLANSDPRVAYQKSKVIRTERLILRKVTYGDEYDIFNNYSSDEEVPKYMTWLPHSDISVTKHILNMWISDYQDNRCNRFVLVDKNSNQVIGMIDVVNYIDNKSVEIGYVLARPYWNKGLMTEACLTFIKYLFNRGYKKIEICAHVDNIGSNRVIEKCGFKFTHQEVRPMSLLKPEIVTINCYELLNK